MYKRVYRRISLRGTDINTAPYYFQVGNIGKFEIKIRKCFYRSRVVEIIVSAHFQLEDLLIFFWQDQLFESDSFAYFVDKICFIS